MRDPDDKGIGGAIVGVISGDIFGVLFCVILGGVLGGLFGYDGAVMSGIGVGIFSGVGIFGIVDGIYKIFP